tara:strand:- start:676 stop:864 length:189 start_codon:yes stop_codon:yes gene_type:complete
MRAGEIAVMMDEHVGLGIDATSYLLHPGDFGLVIDSDKETTALLISGHIIYVRTESIEKLEG